MWCGGRRSSFFNKLSKILGKKGMTKIKELAIARRNKNVTLAFCLVPVVCTFRHSWQLSKLVWNLRGRFFSWANILNSTASWICYIFRFNVNPVNKANQQMKSANSLLLNELRENFSTFSFWCKTRVRFRLYQ